MRQPRTSAPWIHQQETAKQCPQERRLPGYTNKRQPNSTLNKNTCSLGTPTRDDQTVPITRTRAPWVHQQEWLHSLLLQGLSLARCSHLSNPHPHLAFPMNLFVYDTEMGIYIPLPWLIRKYSVNGKNNSIELLRASLEPGLRPSGSSLRVLGPSSLHGSCSVNTGPYLPNCCSQDCSQGDNGR